MEKKVKQHYELPVMTVLEVSWKGVICASGNDEVYGDTKSNREEHWTVDHETEEITRDDDWEEDQYQDWGDSWGEY